MRTPRRAAAIAAVVGLILLGTSTQPSADAAGAASESTSRAGTQLLTGSETSATMTMQAVPDLSIDTMPVRFDVRVSHTAMRRPSMAPWRYPAALQSVAAPTDGTLGPTFELHVTRGQIACASSRAHYADGVVGSWGQQRCSGRFLDDDALVRHGHTRRVADRRFVSGHATELEDNGSLTLRNVPGGSSIVTLSATQGHAACICVALSYPSKRGRAFVMLGMSLGKPEYNVVAPWAEQSRRTGPFVFRPTDAGGWSSAVEGILVYPRWAQG